MEAKKHKIKFDPKPRINNEIISNLIRMVTDIRILNIDTNPEQLPKLGLISSLIKEKDISKNNTFKKSSFFIEKEEVDTSEEAQSIFENAYKNTLKIDELMNPLNYSQIPNYNYQMEYLNQNQFNNQVPKYRQNPNKNYLVYPNDNYNQNCQTPQKLRKNNISNANKQINQQVKKPLPSTKTSRIGESPLRSSPNKYQSQIKQSNIQKSPLRTPQKNKANFDINKSYISKVNQSAFISNNRNNNLSSERKIAQSNIIYKKNNTPLRSGRQKSTDNAINKGSDNKNKKIYNMENSVNAIDKDKKHKLLEEKEMLKNVQMKKMGREIKVYRPAFKDKDKVNDIDMTGVSDDLLERNFTRNYTPDYSMKRKKRSEANAKKIKKKNENVIDYHVDMTELSRSYYEKQGLDSSNSKYY